MAGSAIYGVEFHWVKSGDSNSNSSITNNMQYDFQKCTPFGETLLSACKGTVLKTAMALTSVEFTV